MMSEQEKINIENPLLQNKAAINLLEMVKDFVNQSFISQGVLATLIVQDGQPPCINVSFTLMQTYTRLYQCLYFYLRDLLIIPNFIFLRSWL